MNKYSLLKSSKAIGSIATQTSWQFVFYQVTTCNGFFEYILNNQESVVWRIMVEPERGAVLTFCIGEFDADVKEAQFNKACADALQPMIDLLLNKYKSKQEDHNVNG